MIRSDVNLARLNTFGLPAVAERYLVLERLEQLEDEAFAAPPALVLGGGSNLLLLDRIPGLTVRVNLGGIRQLAPEEVLTSSTHPAPASAAVHLRAAAGVDWNQLVRYTLDRGWYGLENLILIPGTVGAAPVQNIGAYGAEVAEFITAVHVWEYGNGARVLAPADCAFGYRDSYFKRHPGRYLITAVDFALPGPTATARVEYGAIRSELERLGRPDPSPADVALAVTNIRRSKLPDWFFLGNSGSFFKNPVVPRADYERIARDHEAVPSYPIDDDHVKLPAGWLIDRAGLRGTRAGSVGTYARQALVLVNHGGATGSEVLAFSEQIQETVRSRFGVQLEREVRLFGG